MLLQTTQENNRALRGAGLVRWLRLTREDQRSQKLDDRGSRFWDSRLKRRNLLRWKAFREEMLGRETAMSKGEEHRVSNFHTRAWLALKLWQLDARGGADVEQVSDKLMEISEDRRLQFTFRRWLVESRVATDTAIRYEKVKAELELRGLAESVLRWQGVTLVWKWGEVSIQKAIETRETQMRKLLSDSVLRWRFYTAHKGMRHEEDSIDYWVSRALSRVFQHWRDGVSMTEEAREKVKTREINMMQIKIRLI